MVGMKTIPKNCAIYTRKSTDEGLDTEFNTLHAQREACEAYVTSQKAEGWRIVDTLYDDGGYSGGNMERPALKALLDDIRTGKIQTVVVYKIDPLTRSLMDFAKLVDVFDEYGVTFVSVTQSFNTTTSMGRLTLNVLLSFEQFEREVSAERIRNKIAASKKKGMWMGGNPPIGYEVEGKKLLVNKDGAKIAHIIFNRYLYLDSVMALKQEPDKNGIVSKKKISKRGNEIGGKPFSRGALYTILQNPVYIGKIRHKDQIYDGLHEEIIPHETWDAVQEKLQSHATTHRHHKKVRNENLLKGLLFDQEGIPYSPTHTKKDGKRYRYYINQTLLQYAEHPKEAMARLPAHETEQIVIHALRKNICKILHLDSIEDHVLIAYINSPTALTDFLITESINRIIVAQHELSLDVNPEVLRQLLKSHLDLAIPTKFHAPSYLLSVPFTIQRAYKGAVILKPDTPEHDPFDLPPHQLRNLVRGIVWRDEHFSGTSIKNIAAREQLSESGIRKIIMGSFDILR